VLVGSDVKWGYPVQRRSRVAHKALIYTLPALAAGAAAWSFPMGSFHGTGTACRRTGNQAALAITLACVVLPVAVAVGVLQSGIIPAGVCLLTFMVVHMAAYHAGRSPPEGTRRCGAEWHWCSQRLYWFMSFH
jgi:hypothetical protein